MFYDESFEGYLIQKQDWDLIEGYVLNYQKQFSENASCTDIALAKESAGKLIDKLSPLIKKYMSLLKRGAIDWNDVEMKSFISQFMDDRCLIRALNRKKQSASFRKEIYARFAFVLQTYGEVDKEEMITDLQSLLLLKAKRYKQIGKNFCSYLYNSYKYEVARFIKKFTANPINISYKNYAYDDRLLSKLNITHEDDYHNSETGVPDFTWTSGASCSEMFLVLSATDRKILIKYYMEEYNDSQIAEQLGMHINTVNLKRRSASKILAEKLGLNFSDIKRTRKSGKKGIK